MWESENRVLASKLEFHIKKDLTKTQKEKLINGELDLKDLFLDKIECEKYKKSAK